MYHDLSVPNFLSLMENFELGLLNAFLSIVFLFAGTSPATIAQSALKQDTYHSIMFVQGRGHFFSSFLTFLRILFDNCDHAIYS